MLRPRFLPIAIASLPLFAAAVMSASAAGADGEWNCFANGNIPVGTLIVSGTNYDIETRDGASGSGTLEFNGGSIVPRGGPLADDFAVVGSLENTVLYWNNSFGTLMACWPR